MVVSKSSGTYTPMSATVCAYVAGIIDGEGCIFARYNPKSTKRNRYIQHELRVSMNDLKVVEFLQQQTGVGTIYCQFRPTANFYTWRVPGKRGAVEVLAQVLPHLITKYEQAALFLRLSALMRARRDALPHNNDWSDKLHLVEKIITLKRGVA